MEELSVLREEINRIDRQMAELFCDRMQVAAKIGAYKAKRGLPVEDLAREQVLLHRNTEWIPEEGLRSYYMDFQQNVMDLSKHYQSRLVSGMRVAYSGEEGAFADLAAQKIFCEIRPVSYASFADAYHAVKNGECDACVLPVENSYAGEVGQVMDLMFHGNLCLNGLYTLEIRQHLLGLQDAKAEDIRLVKSHPQALMQCAAYIREHDLRTEQTSNTAVAARMVAEEGDPTVGAIAGEEAAKRYGLKILKENIHENVMNTTKFAVLSKLPDDREHGKKEEISLMFTLQNSPGALAKAISAIGKYGYNMHVIRSRPVQDLPWQYYFYVEAVGESDRTHRDRMIEELSAQCEIFKVLGCYEEMKGLS